MISDMAASQINFHLATPVLHSVTVILSLMKTGPEETTSFASLDCREGPWLKEEEDKILAQLSRVRFRINAVVPSIARLPPEVLFQIFTWSRLANVAGANWISFSHVCCFWRNVAVSNPSLWTHLGFWNEKILSLCAARNMDLPLLFYWTETSKHGYHLLNYSSRCISLHVVEDDEDDMSYFVKRFRTAEQSWVQLESVYLELKEGPYVNSFAQDVLYVQKSDGLPGAPRLQVLRMSNIVPQDWSTIAAHGAHLRTLRVHDYCARKDGRRPSLEPFWDMLSSLPVLEHLSLVDSPARRLLPDGISTVSDPERTISLDKLRMLRVVTDCTYDIAYLLSPIRLPSTAIVTIERWLKTAEESILAVFPSDHSRLSDYLDTITCVQLVNSSKPRLGSSCLVLTMFPPNDGACSALYAQFDRCTTQKVVIRSTLFQVASVLSNLTELELCLFPDQVMGISKAEWVEIFQTLPRLEAFLVDGCQRDGLPSGTEELEHVKWFPRLLAEHTTPAQNTEISSVPDSLLPRLTRLYFTAFEAPVREALLEDVQGYLDSRKTASLPRCIVYFNGQRWTISQKAHLPNPSENEHLTSPESKAEL
ncbi:hypothetical protein EIP91_004778 [Steccherinum ochraceum]|uniref:F-box domain-containing protein n=1 Tax=Steccherinum ochraceum TaxID=92696 RepID=A0A4R0RGI2_9APHY|nr:hypothetical protein EIP91_004778 [Steccherinum ochraceum]